MIQGNMFYCWLCFNKGWNAFQLEIPYITHDYTFPALSYVCYRCSPGPDIQPNCTSDEKDIIASNSFCGLITDKNGPFKECHAVIDPLVYFDNCAYDLCEMSLDSETLCNSLQAYAEICQSSGVSILQWRNNSFCGKCGKPECYSLLIFKLLCFLKCYIKCNNLFGLLLFSIWK